MTNRIQELEKGLNAYLAEVQSVPTMEFEDWLFRVSNNDVHSQHRYACELLALREAAGK